MRSFEVPIIYRSPLITHIKQQRKTLDKLKKDFTPTHIQIGNISFYLARHFGFCYGVENAIEIAFKTVDENPGKNIYLLSEMIHNPQVNKNLIERGVQFLQDTNGKQLIPFGQLTKDDIAIIPAFGTTLAIEEKLTQIGIEIAKYNTTCPFVEKVWNRGAAIAQKGYALVIHGKPTHEETRATFSHSAKHTPALIIKDMQEAQQLAAYITQQKTQAQFELAFANRFSTGFNIAHHLKKFGVINQTTMLAEETQAIANYLKEVVLNYYKVDAANEREFIADTKDTLCYATNDNQTAVKELLNTPADMAIIVGGYKSSNTSHLVELCEQKLPTYYIETEEKIITSTTITHFDLHSHTEKQTNAWLPTKENINILISSGASCPDALVENVMRKLVLLTNPNLVWEEAIENYVTNNI
jgi:4-hydroxy-3-methylbut-2-en-1-yl diphosphate reductase